MWIRMIMLLSCLFMAIGSKNALAGSKVLDFDFESTCGSTVLDGSGFGNNGTMHGGGALLIDGVRGKGVFMDGIDDYISVPDASSLDITTGLTMQSWVRLDPNAGSGYLFLKYKFFPNWPIYNDGRGYTLYLDSNNMTVDLYGGYGARVLMKYGPLNVDAWIHITVTYDGSYAHIYLNGVEVAKEPYTGNIAVNDESLIIGRIQGAVDEVRIYDYALSADEVLSSYEAYMKPPAIARLSVSVDPSDPARNIIINWRAPSDFYGNAATAYDIRYSQSPITEENWVYAARARGTYPIPASPGTHEQYKLLDLKPDTRYYVAIKSIDSRLNISSLSDTDSVKTYKLK